MEGLKRRVSFADLQRMPDDGNRYELYDGELRVVPSPLLKHQIVARRLMLVLAAYAERAGGQVIHAPMDVVLSDFDVVQPDLMYFGPRAAGQLNPNDWVRIRPDIAVEVLSLSTARLDPGKKRDLFARHGVPEYWIVDPDARQIEISVLEGGRYGEPAIVRAGRCTSPAQPGLAFDLEPLFAGLD